MSEESLQETIADEAGFKGETDESELQALVSKLKTNILFIGSGGAGNNTLTRLYKEGLVDRNTNSKPFSYIITEKGREKIGSGHTLKPQTA